MKNIRLQSLTLENFQGIERLTLNLDGRSAVISARNRVGKTTLADAWSWLFLEKDTAGRGDFSLKPRDGDGQDIHGLETGVEAVLDIGGESVSLKKTYTEDWTAKRGSATKQLTGHTIDRRIDGVPKAKRAFDDEIASLLGGFEFSLLINPLFFSSEKPHGYGWQARRILLFDICSDIPDADVIASDPRFLELAEVIPAGRSFDDHKAVLKGNRKKLGDRCTDIKAAIRERVHDRPVLPEGFDTAAETAKKIATEAEIERLQMERAQLEAGGAQAEKRRDLAEVEAEILAIEREHGETLASILADKRAELEIAEASAKTAIAIAQEVQQAIATGTAEIEAAEAKLTPMRARIRELIAMGIDEELICDSCEQTIPPALQESAKKRQIAELNGQGKALRAEQEQRKAEVATMREKLPELNATAQAGMNVVEQLKAEIEVIKTRPAVIPPEISARKDELRRQIALIKTDFSPILADLDAKIASQRALIAGADMALRSHEKLAGIETRIAELGAEEKTLSAALEEIERQLFLLEEFTRVKAGMLDERINSRFSGIRFRLFREQINGGLEDCCDALIGGVPFADASKSEQINAGLEIIEVLTEHFGVRMPVFIDNAEAVNALYPLKGQVIALVVSQDRELNIQLEEEADDRVGINTGK